MPRTDNREVECPSCGAGNREGADWCSLCFTSLGPEPPAPRPLTGGPRPLGWTLTRTEHDGPLWYLDDAGDRVAVVTEEDRDTHSCHSVAGDALLFRMERYRAVDHRAYVALAPDGDPLAAFVPASGFVDVRDGTGAPAAALQPSPGGLALIETGGPMIGTCFRGPRHLGLVMDEQWSYTALRPTLVFEDAALMAIPVACRLLFTPPPRPLEAGPVVAGVRVEDILRLVVR